MVSFIIGAVQPERVILFGSAARDDLRTDSDIDVLVVMPNGTDRLRTGLHLYRQKTKQKLRLGHPVQFLVTTRELFERRKDEVGFVYYDIAREGRELYAA